MLGARLHGFHLIAGSPPRTATSRGEEEEVLDWPSVEAEKKSSSLHGIKMFPPCQRPPEELPPLLGL